MSGAVVDRVTRAGRAVGAFVRRHSWEVHGDGRQIAPGAVVGPGERLSWPRTIGIGLQHVVAMFGATVLVPVITQMSPSATLLYSAIGTVLFLVITGNRLPSYLGSSFAFIAPIGAATASQGQATAVGGVLLTGVLLALVGVVVHVAGARWIERVMPPVVTGTIVALIGLNLAPVAWGTCEQEVVDGEIVEVGCSGFRAAPLTGLVTVGSIVLITVLLRGMLGRLAILLGVLVGYAFAVVRGEVDFSAVREAKWLGAPELVRPEIDLSVLVLFLPVVFVLVAENVGHVKSVAAMTGQDYDAVTGRALFADGLATTLAGTGGGSGTTTYAENIGVMAATRVYSTAAYWVAALAALLLSFSPVFSEVVRSVPAGVLGGAGTLLYGMIGVLGARIWIQNRVSFADPVNLTTAAVALIVGIADYTWVVGDGLAFKGIALGTAAAFAIYHVMRAVGRRRGTSADPEPASPASVPGGTELERV